MHRLANGKISRVIVAAAAVSAMALAVGACGSSSSNSSAGSGSAASSGSTSGNSSSSGSGANSKYTLAYITVSAVPALEAMGKGVQAEAKKYGMGFVEESINFDPSAQLAAMHALIARHVSAIITSPLVEKSFATGVKAAQSAKIPVFTYDGIVPGVTQEVTNADQQAAQTMVGNVAAKLKQEGKPCNLVVIAGLPVVPALGARDRGFVAGAKANGCKILASQTDTADTTTAATTIANSFRTRFGSQVGAILPYNDNAALGALASIRSSYQPLVVGFNGESGPLAALKAHRLYEDYALQNAVMGEGLGYAAYRTLKGQSVPRVVYSPYVLLTQSNVSRYRTDDAILGMSPGTLSYGQSGGLTILKDSVGPLS